MDKSNKKNTIEKDFAEELKNKKMSDWTEDDIKMLAQSGLDKMSNDKINELGNNYKKEYKTTQIVFSILTIINIIMIAVSIVLHFVAKTPIQAMAIFIFLALVFPIAALSFKKSHPKLNSENKDWVLDHQIKELKKSVDEFVKTETKMKELDEDLNYINGKEIVDVKIIDSYTEYSDKLHAFLNYQEIIQHRMYKFLVSFSDTSSAVFTYEEGTKGFNKLIGHVKTQHSNEEIETKNVDTTAAQIRDFKKLLDDGIITEEEFQKKKRELLDNK